MQISDVNYITLTYNNYYTDGTPALRTLHANIDRVDEYDTTLFQPANNDIQESDDEGGGLLFNDTNMTA